VYRDIFTSEESKTVSPRIAAGVSPLTGTALREKSGISGSIGASGSKGWQRKERALERLREINNSQAAKWESDARRILYQCRVFRSCRVIRYVDEYVKEGIPFTSFPPCLSVYRPTWILFREQYRVSDLNSDLRTTDWQRIKKWFFFLIMRKRLAAAVRTVELFCDLLPRLSSARLLYIDYR